jgi:DNA-binding IscR family transcriptional regulator
MESYRLDQTAKGVSEGYKDFLAMQVMLLVARNFMKGRLGLNVDDLAHEAHASVRLVNDVTYRLCRAGLLVETAQPRKCFSPAVPLEQITPYTVLKRIRSTGKFPGPLCATPDSEIIMKMVDRADAAGTESFKHLTYRELAEEANRRTEAAAAPAGQTPQASPTPGANPGT